MLGHQPGTMRPPARVHKPVDLSAVIPAPGTKTTSFTSPTIESLRANDKEWPTHHELNPENLDTYIYPTNLDIREYQYNIVKTALFANVLCALPTGLGKTYIASTVMLNYFRWTKHAKIIFMAPTRPLVSQQLEACLGITGIPATQASILMGTVHKKIDKLNGKINVFFLQLHRLLKMI